MIQSSVLRLIYHHPWKNVQMVWIILEIRTIVSCTIYCAVTWLHSLVQTDPPPLPHSQSYMHVCTDQVQPACSIILTQSGSFDSRETSCFHSVFTLGTCVCLVWNSSRGQFLGTRPGYQRVKNVPQTHRTFFGFRIHFEEIIWNRPTGSKSHSPAKAKACAQPVAK